MIQKNMTSKERDFWWRLTHRLIITKKRESKYKSVQPTCRVCGKEDEDWTHYDYECQKMKEFREQVRVKAGLKEISREQWSLEARNMTAKTMTIIAKARWIHHKERCQKDMGKRKRMNMKIQMERLDRALTIIEDKEKEERKEKEKRKEIRK